MTKLLPGIVILLFIHLYSIAQIGTGDRPGIPGDEKKLLSELKNSTPGIKQADILLNLSAHYLFSPGEKKEDLDKALLYGQKAQELCTSLKYVTGYNEAIVLITNIFIEALDPVSAMPYLKNSREITRIRLLMIFSYYYRYHTNNGMDTAILYARQARELSAALHQPEREAKALVQIAEVYWENRNFTFTENTLLDLVNVCKANNLNALSDAYTRLADLTIIKGDFNKALFYALETIKSMHSYGDTSRIVSAYYNLGIVYRNIGQFEKCIVYYTKTFDAYKKTRDWGLYNVMGGIAGTLLKLNRNKEAIDFLDHAAKESPPRNNSERIILDYNLGRCYMAMNRYELAENYFKQVFEMHKNYTEVPFVYQMGMGQLYTEWRKYDLAKPYLEKAYLLIDATLPTITKAYLHFMLYRADSAAGNYLSAINHLIMNKALDDSTYNQTKASAIVELQVKYETEKKNQDIAMQRKNILLLQGDAELQQKNLEQISLTLDFEKTSNEQSLKLANAEAAKKDNDLVVKQKDIELLQQDKLLQETRLKQTKDSRNMMTAGAIMLLFILILGYNRYRLKQVTNKRLEAHQKDIHEKNKELLQLINEKEWLLKEVHHRVKNNLQTVVSLLESQSAYLQNDALMAIQDSQNRVHTMSLIHQKLYQNENVAAINMADYLPELINYLRDSFKIKQQIHFHLQIFPLELDVSQAVPIGLILNEAITNSIKYAFPLTNNHHNEIAISLTYQSTGRVELTIADNGIGLPANIKPDKSGSLGLKLMNGLTKDIGGEFECENHNGCKITVRFIIDTPLQHISNTNTPLLNEKSIKESVI